jgi:hypothetical protein
MGVRVHCAKQVVGSCPFGPSVGIQVALSGTQANFCTFPVVPDESPVEEEEVPSVPEPLPEPLEAAVDDEPEDPVPVEVGGVQDSILKEPVQLMEYFVMVRLTPAHCFPGMVPL